MRVLLADIQGLQGDVTGSIPIYQQAYADFRSCSGDSSANTLLTQARLARVMLKVGQGKEVIAMLEPSLPVWRTAFPHSPDIAEPLVFLAKAYIQTSQFPRAESAANQALQAMDGKVEAGSAARAVLELLLAQQVSLVSRTTALDSHHRTLQSPMRLLKDVQIPYSFSERRER